MLILPIGPIPSTYYVHGQFLQKNVNELGFQIQMFDRTFLLIRFLANRLGFARILAGWRSVSVKTMIPCHELMGPALFFGLPIV
jgi:hypothetical protein